MYRFNIVGLESISQSDRDLNTTHVSVQLAFAFELSFLLHYLNTTHVSVQYKSQYIGTLPSSDLNTTHVSVQFRSV